MSEECARNLCDWMAELIRGDGVDMKNAPCVGDVIDYAVLHKASVEAYPFLHRRVQDLILWRTQYSKTQHEQQFFDLFQVSLRDVLDRTVDLAPNMSGDATCKTHTDFVNHVSTYLWMAENAPKRWLKEVLVIQIVSFIAENLTHSTPRLNEVVRSKLTQFREVFGMKLPAFAIEVFHISHP